MNEEEKDTQATPAEEAPTEPKIDESVPEPVALDTQAIEPVSVPEIPPETPTAQTSGNEPLPEIPPTPNEGAEAKTSAPEEQPRTPAREERKREETPKQEPSQKERMGLLQKIARATIGLRREKKLAKILTLFAKQTEITNDNVEKLLHVSDATATRYLNELEKRGKLTQHGKTGHAVRYTKR